MDKALSESELLGLVDGKCKVVLYSDMHKYSSLAELLAPYNAVFLLYQQTEMYGHWCVIFKQGKDTIECFDPYGIFPDDELLWTKRSMRTKLNMDYPYLTELLYKAPYMYSIVYNEHKFQKLAKNISTCGRWCACRLAMRHLTLDQFLSLFDMKGGNNDLIVTKLTEFGL